MTAPRRRGRLRVRQHDPLAVAGPGLRVAAIAAGVALGFAIIGAQSGLGLAIFSSTWGATFGSAFGIAQVISYTTPLVLTGAAVQVGRKAGLFNVGVEGQIFFGAWCATGAAYAFGELAGPLLVAVMLAASLLGGAVWSLLPAVTRAYLGVNEIVTTLMGNFVALLWVTYWARGPWADSGSQGAGSVSARSLPEQAALGSIHIGRIAIGGGLVVAVAVLVALAAAARYSRGGYWARLTGIDEEMAVYAGVDVARMRVAAMLLSGAIGGLAGGVILLDQTHVLSISMSNNAGYVGFVVAALAGTSLLVCLPMATLMGALVAAGLALQISGVTPRAVLFFTGLLLLLAAGADVAARFRIVRTGDEARASGEGRSRQLAGAPRSRA